MLDLEAILLSIVIDSDKESPAEDKEEEVSE